MSNVDRYDFEDYGTLESDGRYVKYEDYETLEEERQKVLKVLQDVLENYRANNRKGIGIGPLIRARAILDSYGIPRAEGDDQ